MKCTPPCNSTEYQVRHKTHAQAKARLSTAYVHRLFETLSVPKGHDGRLYSVLSGDWEWGQVVNCSDKSQWMPWGSLWDCRPRHHWLGLLCFRGLLLWRGAFCAKRCMSQWRRQRRHCYHKAHEVYFWQLSVEERDGVLFVLLTSWCVCQKNMFTTLFYHCYSRDMLFVTLLHPLHELWRQEFLWSKQNLSAWWSGCRLRYWCHVPHRKSDARYTKY